MTQPASSPASRSTMATALWRGCRRRCPRCNERGVFAGYLALAPACPACGLDTGAFRPDDGPAYVTMLLVGHLMAPLIFAFDFSTELPPALSLAVWLPLTAAAVFMLLPPVKGGFLGALWAAGIKG